MLLVFNRRWAAGHVSAVSLLLGLSQLKARVWESETDSLDTLSCSYASGRFVFPPFHYTFSKRHNTTFFLFICSLIIRFPDLIILIIQILILLSSSCFLVFPSFSTWPSHIAFSLCVHFPNKCIFRLSCVLSSVLHFPSIFLSFIYMVHTSSACFWPICDTDLTACFISGGLVRSNVAVG